MISLDNYPLDLTPNETSPTHSGLLPIHFLSYSSGGTLHTCPKEFQIYKMGEAKLSERNVTYSFGHAVGAGVQSLLCGDSLELAIWQAFCAWDVDLFDYEEKSKKAFHWVVNALEKFLPYAVQIHKDYEVATFDGKQAKELSFQVLFPHGFRYRAHIDVVLRHKVSGELLVVELKTTKAKTIMEATYGNSRQALSYSVVLDKIASGNASYKVWYIIYQTELEDYEPMPFTKTALDKAKWIKGILVDCEQVRSYQEQAFYPQYDGSCVRFFRPCQYYGMCGMSDKSLLASPEELEARVQKELKTPYTFTFTLDEIIQQQLGA